MKVNGIVLTSMRIVEVYLPISGGQAVEFKFRPLRSDENFESILTKPEPPTKTGKGGVKHANVEDKFFKDAVTDWVTKKLDWEFLTSVSITEGLEWETVNMGDPNTWKNWRDDAAKVFGNSELNKLFGGFLDAQYLTEEVMEKARERFLTGRRDQLEALLSQTGEADSTESTKPVSVSESDPPA